MFCLVDSFCLSMEYDVGNLYYNKYNEMNYFHHYTSDWQDIDTYISLSAVEHNTTSSMVNNTQGISCIKGIK